MSASASSRMRSRWLLCAVATRVMTSYQPAASRRGWGPRRHRDERLREEPSALRDRAAGDLGREVLEGEHERRPTPVEGHTVGHGDIGQAAEQLLEDRLDLHAGQVRPEAEVGTDAEGQVR